MQRKPVIAIAFLALMLCAGQLFSQSSTRTSFNNGWYFHLGEITAMPGSAAFLKEKWVAQQLPHDWSIGLPFDKESPTGTGGGALRGGVGWYYKLFSVPSSAAGKKVFIEFDGVYMNSEVLINGHSLGIRPSGYIGFRYELTPYLKYGNAQNCIAVRVDNSRQPNSRWYSGSGIYRNVWLQLNDPLHIVHRGTSVLTPEVNKVQASIQLKTTIQNTAGTSGNWKLITELIDPSGKKLQQRVSTGSLTAEGKEDVSQSFSVSKPQLWSTANPALYTLKSGLYVNGKLAETYSTTCGLRYFHFDTEEGFFLNGQSLKIRGVCNHHDLGCLGTAFNTRAAERQLQLLRDMGCNAIRTSHNPPAPELLDLCDKMGFLVMDEAFDMWKKEKTPFDYHMYWDEWHQRDLTDQVLRDRNHPSVIIWSVGNEILEQWDRSDDTATTKLKELYGLVKNLDSTRPVVTANNETGPWNRLLRSNVSDLIGYNYAHARWDSVFMHWYRKPFIITESTSALQTRGHYDMPSDSNRIWPRRWDLPMTEGNADTTCSAYDNCRTPWGSSHETSLQLLESRKHISGMFVWTGFDYIGEPTPYPWPARSSYFGIIDLAGFPKDVYYLYKSAWSEKPVLHVFPHWNWKPGQLVDLWAYYNNADEAELFLNGVSQGIRKKTGDAMHVVWRLTFAPGEVKVITRRNGKTVLEQKISTTGPAAKIILVPDTRQLKAGSKELSFVTVKVCDQQGREIPDAARLIKFSVSGNAAVVATDNGSPTDLSLFSSPERMTMAGRCLVLIGSGDKKGKAVLTATANGLTSAQIVYTIQ